MTKDNWIKAYREKFRGETLSDYGDEVTFDENQEMYQEMIDFISQVEKDAIEKTNKGWRGKFDDIKADGATRLECGCEVMKVTLCDKHAGFIPLSDLLEQKDGV